jgi:ribosomal protein S18 acetylase RimI-like enzyme
MPDVALVPLEPSRFDAFIEGTIERYAEELNEAGYAIGEAALKKSRNDTLALLPQGVDTPGHHFYVITDRDNNEEVGNLWIRLETEPRRTVFIFSLFLNEQYRGRGYGKATMARLDEVAKELGAEAINLHVFGPNERAIRLYRSSGYEVRSLNMGKELAPSK